MGMSGIFGYEDVFSFCIFCNGDGSMTCGCKVFACSLVPLQSLGASKKYSNIIGDPTFPSRRLGVKKFGWLFDSLFRIQWHVNGYVQHRICQNFFQQMFIV